MLVLWVTDQGRKTALRLSQTLKGLRLQRYHQKWVQEAFSKKIPLVFIAACGIAVRAVAPFLKHKSQDPPVLVIDERGRFVISLLSGHLGGANALTEKIAQALGALPIITTASEIRGLPALDIWLRENEVQIKDWKILTRLQARFLEHPLKIYLEPPLSLPLPPRITLAPKEEADMLITYRETERETDWVIKALVIGVGFHDHETSLVEKVLFGLRKFGFSPRAVKYVATVERRKGRPVETLAENLGAQILYFTPEEIRRVSPPSPSKASEALALPGVAEPCALLGAEYGPLILPKQVIEGVTFAVALRKEFS